MKPSSQAHLQNLILLHLSHEPTQTVSSLADALHVTRSSASRAVNALITAGMLTKEGRRPILKSAGRTAATELEQQLPKAAEKAGKAVVRILGQASAAKTETHVSTLQGLVTALQPMEGQFKDSFDTLSMLESLFPKPADLGLNSVLEALHQIPKPADLGLNSVLEAVHQQHLSFGAELQSIVSETIETMNANFQLNPVLSSMMDVTHQQHLGFGAKLPSIISKTIEAMGANLQSVSALSSMMIPSPFFTALQDSLSSFAASFGSWFDEIRRELNELELAGPLIGPIFLAAGFWVSPSTPLWLLRDIRARHDAGTLTPEELRRLFVDAYHADDCELLRYAVHHSWSDNPLFAARMDIFIDALEAHIGGKYTLSVPALLPQIESIASAFTGVPHGQTRAAVSAAAGNVSASFVPAISRDVLLAYITTMAYADTRTATFYTELSRQGLVLEQVLQRHAILHGITISYANEENSLRAFLLLDALSRIGVPEAVS